MCKESEKNVNCNRHDKKFLLARRSGANRCLLPDGQVSELNLFPLALEADMPFLHPVRRTVLQYVIDIGRDNSLFHRDAHLVPFAGGFFTGWLLFTDNRER